MTKEELKALGVPDDVADKIVEDYGKITSARPSSTRSWKN